MNKETKEEYNVEQTEERKIKKEQYKTKRTIAFDIFLVVICYLGTIIVIAFDKNNNTAYLSTFLALLSLAIIIIFETAEWLKFKSDIIIKTPQLFLIFFITFIVIGILMKKFWVNKENFEIIPNVLTSLSMVIYIISVYARYCSELKNEYKKNTLK